jgi:hypothetical protein
VKRRGNVERSAQAHEHRPLTHRDGWASGRCTARLRHRDCEAVALEDGAVAPDESPLHVEADSSRKGAPREISKCSTPAPPSDVVSFCSFGAGSMSQLAPVQTPSGLRSTRRRTVNVVSGMASCRLTVPWTLKVPGPTTLSAVGATSTMPAPWPAIAVRSPCVPGSAEARAPSAEAATAHAKNKP